MTSLLDVIEVDIRGKLKIGLSHLLKKSWSGGYLLERQKFNMIYRKLELYVNLSNSNNK